MSNRIFEAKYSNGAVIRYEVVPAVKVIRSVVGVRGGETVFTFDSVDDFISYCGETETEIREVTSRG